MSLNSEEKNTAYEKLTPQRKQLVDKVMENLEKGNLFWTQGWVSSGAPESAITGKKYRGINNLFLSLIAMSENYGDMLYCNRIIRQRKVARVGQVAHERMIPAVAGCVLLESYLKRTP